MADNVTPPTIVTIGTHELGGVHYQEWEDVSLASGSLVRIPGTVLGKYVDLRHIAPITTPTVTSVSWNASTVTLVAANANRRSLKIFNNGTTNLYVKQGSGASTSSASFYIVPGQLYEWHPSDIDPGIVTGVWVTGGSGAAFITETV